MIDDVYFYNAPNNSKLVEQTILATIKVYINHL